MIEIRLNIVIIRIIIIAIALTSCGCASTNPYLANRGHDLADIVSLQAGFGVGARARVGPIHAGLFTGVDFVGLRGGNIENGANKPDEFYGRIVTDIPFWYSENCIYAETNRHKAYMVGSRGILVAGGKGLNAYGSRLTCPYYTEIVVQGGLIYGLRLGFNPVELLDFLLGWTTIDIYGDDVGVIAKPVDQKVYFENRWEQRKKEIYEEQRNKPQATNSVQSEKHVNNSPPPP